MTSYRSNLPNETSRESVLGQPFQVPGQNSDVPTIPEANPLSYQTGVDVMSGVLSYAERTSPGISSRILAGDFLALATGLLSAAGLAAGTRRVNVCSPAVLTSVLTAAGASPISGAASGAWQVVTRAKKVTKKKPATAGKSSDAGKKAGKDSAKGKKTSKSSSPTAKPSTSSGPKTKANDKAKGSSLSATSTAATRQRLLNSALKSLKKLSRPVAPVDMQSSGGVSNMRCAHVQDVTKEQVTSKVNSLSDKAVAERDLSIHPLVFLGIVPKDSIDGQLLNINKKARMAGVIAAGASNKEAQPTTTMSKPVLPKLDRGTMAQVVAKGSKGKARETPASLGSTYEELTSSRLVTIRAVRPYFPTASEKTPRDKVIALMRGVPMEPVGDEPLPVGAVDSEDLFCHFMDWIRSSGSPATGRVVTPNSRAAFLSVTYEKVPMGVFVIMSKSSGKSYVVIINSTMPHAPETFLEGLPDYRISQSFMNIFPYESPPRPTQASLTRRTSNASALGVPSSVQGQQASSDAFADLYSLSSAPKRG